VELRAAAITFPSEQTCGWRFLNDSTTILQIAEFLFGQARLLEDGTKGSGGNIPGVHRQVGLPPILVPQHQVRAALPPFLEGRPV
jgi:hypothetical protein